MISATKLATAVIVALVIGAAQPAGALDKPWPGGGPADPDCTRVIDRPCGERPVPLPCERGDDTALRCRPVSPCWIEPWACRPAGDDRIR
jgi:hypothetical protein